MIFLYSGTPGSGKSYHALCDIVDKLRRRTRNGVIANFPVVTENIRRVRGRFDYWDNSEVSVDRLVQYAVENHVVGVEGQTLLVLDECGGLFNSRDWQSGQERMRWVHFFSQHRKLGYNIILIAQFDRMLDRQIRCCVEYKYSHLKINNAFGLLPLTAFLCVQRWYGQRLRLGSQIIPYRRSRAKLYDSYAMFTATGPQPITAAAGRGDPPSGGGS